MPRSLPRAIASRRRASKPGIIGGLQRHLQGRLVIAAVVLQRDRRLVREGVGRDEIAAAQFGRVDAELVGGEIDDAFQQEGRLRPAGAAIGVDRHGMGEHRLGLDIDRRGRIGAGEQGPVEIGRDAGREGRQIGAHIGDRRHLEREELGVAVERQLDMGDVVAAMRVRHEAFRALGGPFDRPPDLAGGPGDDRLLGVMVDLRAEAAADIGGDDAQLRLRDVQHEGAHQQADHMRVLAGRDRACTRRSRGRIRRSRRAAPSRSGRAGC